MRGQNLPHGVTHLRKPQANRTLRRGTSPAPLPAEVKQNARRPIAQNVQTPFFPMVRHANDWRPAKSGALPSTQVASNAAATPAATATASTTTKPEEKSFWQDVLDVVNPLQHLPVVGTVYRAITGDKMGDVEKVAGDTLYGGPIGLVSSLADVAFEKITGKSFEDTAMGWVGLGGSDTKTIEAATAPALKPLPARTTEAASITPFIAPVVRPATAQQASAAPMQLPTQISTQANNANTQALMAAMNQNGVDSDLGMRALFAYQKSMGLDQTTGADPAP